LTLPLLQMDRDKEPSGGSPWPALEIQEGISGHLAAEKRQLNAPSKILNR